MVEISVKEQALHVELLGWSKLLALAGSLDIPIACIRSAAAGPPGLPKFQWGDRRGDRDREAALRLAQGGEPRICRRWGAAVTSSGSRDANNTDWA